MERERRLAPLAPVRPAKPPLNAIEIRERLKEYFIGPGQGEWQWNVIVS